MNLTLPPLHQALGRHAFASPAFRVEFAELFQQLDQVQAELSEISGRSPAAAKSLGDKAKAMAGQVMQAAQSQHLSLRQSSLFGTLGKAVYDKHEAESGPQELVKPIADSVARLAILDSDLDGLSANKDGSWITPKRLAISIGAAACVLLLILMLRMDRGGILGVSNTEADIKKGARPMEVQLIDSEIPEVPGTVTDYDRGFVEGQALGDTYMQKYRSWPKGQTNAMTDVMQVQLQRFTEMYELQTKFDRDPSDIDKSHGQMDGFRMAIQESGVK